MKNHTHAAALAAFLLLALPADAAFRCVDKDGRTHFGDTPPEQCANVVMYEVSRTGQVIRTIQPSLTEEQVKAKLAEDERRKEADKVAAEQKRKDLALLATFSSENEFDVVRDRNIEPIKGRIKSAQERMVAIDKRNKELDDELEFYKAGKSAKATGGKKVEAPPMLVDEQKRLAHEKAVLARNIVGYEKEIAELTSKFAVDKRRWLALKSGKLEAIEARPAEAKPVEVKADAKKK